MPDFFAKYQISDYVGENFLIITTPDRDSAVKILTRWIRDFNQYEKCDPQVQSNIDEECNAAGKHLIQIKDTGPVKAIHVEQWPSQVEEGKFPNH